MEQTGSARRKRIFTIAMPVLIELLMGTLFGMVDMIMLGNSGTGPVITASIAAIGITNQYLFIGLSLVSALTTGATAIIARYIGAGKPEKIESVVKHILVLTLLATAVPITLFGLWQTDAIMRFIGAQPDAIEVGRSYFKVVMIGFTFQAFNFAVFAAMRGAQDTKSPMRINLIVNGLNVVGNAILIFGLFGFPRLGVTGAGISTAFAQVVAMFFTLRYLLQGKHQVKLTRGDKFKFDRNILYNLVKVGIPAAAEQALFRVGMLLYVRTVAGLGTTVYATHQLALNILMLSFTIGQAFATAASTLTGHALGMEDEDLAEEYMQETSRYGVLLSLGVAVLFFFFSPYVVRLYTSDTGIINAASDVLKLIAIIQPFQASQFILAGGLRGAGDTMWTLVSTGVGVLGVRNLAAFVLVSYMGWGLTGAWVALIIDQLVRWVLIKLRVRTGKWKYVKLR